MAHELTSEDTGSSPKDVSPCEPMVVGDPYSQKDEIEDSLDRAAEELIQLNEELNGKATRASSPGKEQKPSKRAAGDSTSPKAQSPTKHLNLEIEAKLRRWTRHRPGKIPKFDVNEFNRWKRKMNIAIDAKVFIVADVVPDFKQELLDRGWIENVWDPDGPWFDLKWKISRNHVDYDSLAPPQIVNHYQRTAEMTTKAGLNRHLKEAQDLNEFAVDSWYPKTYHLCSKDEIANFTLEFKMHKAEGILKEWVKQKDSKKPLEETIPEDVVRAALSAAKRRLVDIDALLDEEENEAELVGFWITDDEWAVLNEVDFEQPGLENTSIKKFKQEYNENERTKVLRQVQDEEALKRRVAELQRIAEKFQERQRKAMKQRRYGTYTKSKSSVSSDTAWSSDASTKCSSSKSSLSSSQGSAAPLSSSSEIPKDAYPGAGEPLDSQELLKNVKEVIEALKKAFPQFSLAGSRNTWVLKPHARARGEGIFLSANLEEITSMVGKVNMSGSWMCQKYLENPFLVDGRKNDIRQWVLVTSWNPLKIWFFTRTYIRMAADTFSLTNIQNRMGHVSNNNVTEFHPDYDADDDYYCFAMIDTEYAAAMQERYRYDAYNETVVPAMKKIVIESLSVFQEALNESQAVNCAYEMLGFDFMVDDDLGVWLIEINSSPSMKYATPVHRQLVPVVMRDCVRVIVGGEPKEPEKGYFEVILDSPDVFSSHKTSDALSGLKVEGQRLAPPEKEKPEVVLLDEDAMVAKRDSEIQALVEKMRLKKEKEEKKRARRERILKGLRKGGLMQCKSMKVKATAAENSLPQDDEPLTSRSNQDDAGSGQEIECGTPSDALEALILSKKMSANVVDASKKSEVADSDKLKPASPVHLPAIQTPNSNGTSLTVQSSSSGLLSPKRFLQEQGATIVSTSSSR